MDHREQTVMMPELGVVDQKLEPGRVSEFRMRDGYVFLLFGGFLM